MKLSHDTHEPDEPAPFDDENLPPPDHPISIAVTRVLSDTLMLWRLCLSARCRRNGACKGDPHECLAIGIALLSDDVYDGCIAFVEAKCEGLTFDQAVARWPDELAAFGEWTRRIERNPAQRR